jgi:SAM-dependent methyltransferase
MPDSRWRDLSRPLRTARRRQDPASKWFWDHYEVAAREIVAFCDGGGVELGGKRIADIGCGDGIMALGLCRRTSPESLIGFDVVPTDTEQLLGQSRREGVGRSLPERLEFRTSNVNTIPAEAGQFDFVYSWSAFEHIADPRTVLGEIHRILSPQGHFFLQLWPFYFSAKGSHLWDWDDTDFHHLIRPHAEIVDELRASGRHPQGGTDYRAREFEHLNRVTVDELQRAVLAAGFDVRKLELLAHPVHLEPELSRYSWTDLGIGGIKLIATPQR